MRLEQRLEALDTVRAAVDHDERRWVIKPGHRLLHRPKGSRLNEDDASPAVTGEVLEVRWCIQVTDRNGDGADSNGSQKHGRPGGRVVHRHQNPLFPLDGQSLERPSRAADAVVQAGVCQLLGLAADGDLLAATRL